MSEDELALSFLLTEKFLSQAKLDAASRRLNSGLKIELPAHVKSAVLAAFESARAKQVEVEKKVGLNAYGWSIIAAVILLALLCFHPRPHYQWASFRDTAEAYEGFVKRFPSSAYTDTAKERARILREPEIWSHAKAVDQIESMRGYVRIYPDGRNIDYAKKRITELADAEWKLISNTNSRNEVLKFLKAYPEASKTREAEERLVSIADAQWDKISTTRSITAINTYLADYPETPRRREAEKRIEFLYSDWDWVREEDSIAAYQRFLTRNPNHPEQKWIEKRIIDLEVREIAAGEHGEMPQAQPISFGGTVVEVEVENQTEYELTVRYSGPDSKKLVVAKGTTQSVSLSPGEYKVAASVSAANVRNYYGSDSMQRGRYSSSFYIQTGFGDFAFPKPTPKRGR